jgi:hypothetical protein
MVAKRTSDDWPILTQRTLRFNALLSSVPRSGPYSSSKVEDEASLRVCGHDSQPRRRRRKGAEVSKATKDSDRRSDRMAFEAME